MKLRNIIAVVFVIASITAVPAQSVTLKQIGKPNILLNFSHPVFFNGAFYSLNIGKGLYKTDLATGDHSQLGNAVYQNTRLLFGIYNRLYSIENDGSMTQIDPTTGARSVVSSIGTWTNVNHAIPVGNSFFSIENGALYTHTALNIRARKQIGDAEFYEPGTLIRTDSTLHSISGGSVYKINTTTGEWQRIGKGKQWKNSTAAAVIGNKLYTIENFSLYETSLPDGTRKQLDAAQFEKHKFLFSTLGKLYSISREGTLYEISWVN